MNIWTTILKSYNEYPRDVKTYTKTNCKVTWFYVYSDNENVYVQTAKNHIDKSKIKSTVRLKSDEVDAVYDMYKKYMAGVVNRCEFRSITWNSSYWIGIFKDIGIK